MNRVLVGVVAALVLALSGALYGLYVTAAKVGSTLARAEAAEALLAQEKARTERTRDALAKAIELAGKSRQEVDRGIQENPDWASGAVPDRVIDGLCQYGNCTD